MKVNAVAAGTTCRKMPRAARRKIGRNWRSRGPYTARGPDDGPRCAGIGAHHSFAGQLASTVRSQRPRHIVFSRRAADGSRPHRRLARDENQTCARGVDGTDDGSRARHVELEGRCVERSRQTGRVDNNIGFTDRRGQGRGVKRGFDALDIVRHRLDPARSDDGANAPAGEAKGLRQVPADEPGGAGDANGAAFHTTGTSCDAGRPRLRCPR